MRFDHSNLGGASAVLLHVAQWSAAGVPEGGISVAALTPTA
jgi:hypothetical protein